MYKGSARHVNSATIYRIMKSICVGLLCVVGVVVSHLSSCNGFGDDMFDFAKTQLNQVSEKVVKSLHRSSGGGVRPGVRPVPRPSSRPDSRGPKGKKLGNNKYVSAMLQVNKAMAEAEGRRLSFTPTFLKKVARLAVDANELNQAREVFGYGMYEDFKKFKSCMKRKRRQDMCVPPSNGIAGQIRSLIGDEKFNRLMAVEGNVDLIFTIDTTGSMREEISAAKAIVRSIATYEREADIKYTLSPFNDPGTGPVRRFSDRFSFLRALNSLRAHGGGDCKELTFHGIHNAIVQTKPPLDSPMFVFTDAGPKDEDAEDVNRDDAIGKALDYSVPVSFFFSKSPGGCKSPTTFESFHEIVDATQGVSLLFDHRGTKLENMGEIVRATLDGMSTIKSGRVRGSSRGRALGLSRRGPLGGFRPISRGNIIPVDDSVEKLVVVITVERNEGLVHLRDPRGRIVPKTHRLVNGALWIITHPTSGDWSLRIPSSVGSHSYKVTSSSVLNIDFDYYFIRTLPGNRHVEIPIADPLIGTQMKVKVLIPLKDKLRASSLYLDTIDKYGYLISTSPVNGNTATFHRPPSQPFKLRLRGITLAGFKLERVSRRIVTAKPIIIRMVYNRNYFTLPRGRATSVRFAIHNHSGRSGRFRLSLTSSIPQISIRIRNPVKYIRSGAVRYVAFRVLASRSLRPGTFLRMFVKATGIENARLAVQMMIL